MFQEMELYELVEWYSENDLEWQLYTVIMSVCDA